MVSPSRRTGDSARRLLRALSMLLLFLPLGGCQTSAERVPAASATTSEETPPRQLWEFPVDRVRFDSGVDGARLSHVERIGPSHFRARIDPESWPINPSPWYGFRVASELPARIRIELDFGQTPHRYHPKLSVDGLRWRDADAHEFRENPVRLELSLQAHKPLLVFAQRPVSGDALTEWSRAQAAALGVPLKEFGTSVRGRSLHLFEFGGSDTSEVVLVLGRQHPPETTGSRALMGFVEALAADTDAARAYRHRYRTIVVALLNPDGVAEGLWRGNANARDLNRDWGPFEQPETRALRDALLARSEDDALRLLFAIDFHSTWKDVLYTVADDPALAPGGLLREWIDAMHERFPDRIREEAYAATTSVFKNWVYCTYGAASVTYEVGDETPEPTLQSLSRFAAKALMQLLARKEWSPTPGPDRCPATR
jgi:hypothetical protein